MKLGDLMAMRGLFQSNDAAAAIFIRKDNNPWKKGDKLVQRDLAKTLKRISKYGRDGFYTGPVADLIVAEMKRGNGLISLEDLKNYLSVYRDHVSGTYNGHEVISMGPPSSGGALLVNMMNMLETLFFKDFLHFLSFYYSILSKLGQFGR